MIAQAANPKPNQPHFRGLRGWESTKLACEIRMLRNLGMTEKGYRRLWPNKDFAPGLQGIRFQVHRLNLKI